MSQGTVKWFNDQKGYGFISATDGKDYFVHHSSIVGEGFRTLKEGAQVEFDIEKTDRGPRAVQVTLI
ncbi:MAG TPA: cold shock domain-containing protein [Spirochaetota bacterium]|nr:cold shock domain-containing protein [Spirochaetota bacterium]HPF07737.1 cold shock domain-containing protein [Spirochaetota bacterium]HPJ44054.1 cold shock domain-containing protein [Spirochaetota bacterium]HPR39063.1 cold shock domain-containing protein [Spirochaetota bacterium]HRX49147.1 cold shock domain-containing protein [Spirochaetota bacterium]